MTRAKRPWGGLAIFLLLILGSACTRAAEGPAGLFVQGGALPEHLGFGNASLSPLPDGRALLYGVPKAGEGTLADQQKALRTRFDRHGTSGSLHAAPRLWQPDQRRWDTLERPPECRMNAELATATVLPDGQVLIAGGLCDLPRMADDVSPVVPHTAMSRWNGKTGRWEAAPALAGSRIFHTASLLKDGTVMIVGGQRDPALASAAGMPVLASSERYRSGRIEPASELNTARARHSATVLADGTLLVAGGFDADGRALASAEQWDAAGQRWTALPPMTHARHGHSATLLDDGRVMVVGGTGAQGEAIGAVEYWDPALRSWVPGRPMLQPVAGPIAARLSGGDVLVLIPSPARSATPASAMVWSRQRGDWLPAGSTVPMPHGALLLPRPDGSAYAVTDRHLLRWRPIDGNVDRHKAAHPSDLPRSAAAFTPLPDGRILITGGYRGESFVDVAEVLEPQGNRFQLTGRMLQARHSHRGIALPDGQVLVAGGWARSLDDLSQPRDSMAEVWNPRSGLWTAVPGIRFAWQEVVHFNLLDDGRVFFLASRERGEGASAAPLAYRALLWHPGTGEVTDVKVPLTPRSQAAIAIRPDGSVFAAGGFNRDGQFDARTELWNISGGTVDTQGERMPAPGRGQPHALPLRDGGVFVGLHEPLNPSAGLQRGAPLRWSATTRTWTTLPPLFLHEAARVIELADGTLLSPAHRLPPGGSEWVDSSPTQGVDAVPVLQPSGRAVSVDIAPPHVAFFDPTPQQWRTQLPPDASPAWIQKPALALLRDGRVLAVGSVDSGPASVSTAHVWQPQLGLWSSAGRLARRYGEGQAVTLASGQVIHLGQYDGAQHVCERWVPGTQDWVFCQTLSAAGGSGAAPVPGGSGATSRPVLGLLADGRAAVLWGGGDALVFNEADSTWQPMPVQWNREPLPIGAPVRPQQGFVARVTDPAMPQQPVDASALASRYLAQQHRGPSALWDEAKREWRFAFARSIGLGDDALVLPDGCAISLSAMRRFDPSTGHITALETPPVEGDLRSAASLLLPDGTVVAAMAAPVWQPGTQAFFQRKADCGGFMPADGEPARAAPAPASAAAAPPAQAVPGWPERLAEAQAWVQEHRLPTMLSIVLVGLVGLAVRERWMRWRRGQPPPAPSRWSRPFQWTVRIVVYGFALLVLVRCVGMYRTLSALEKDDRCAVNPAACVDPRTGLIEGARDIDETPRIPCRFVGVWSSIRPTLVLRITLADDGVYTASQNLGTAERHGQSYQGRWAVQGRHMVWRHAQNDPGRPDTNAIVDESDGRFTLVEENGSRTRFERIEAVASQRCVP